MQTPNEFWLCLHEFSRAVDAEGRNSDERRANIAASLDKMPSTARAEVIAELGEVLAFLPDLYAHVAATSADGRKRST
jgi:hypothetical protein